MKQIFLITVFSLSCLVLSAQKTNDINHTSSQSGILWNRTTNESKDLLVQEYIDLVLYNNNSSSYNRLLKSDTKVDELGWSHHHYKQYYEGLEVLGSKYIVHEYDHQIIKSNGLFISDIKLNIIPIITSDMALRISNELLLENNNSKTSQPRLCLADRRYPLNTNQLHLCYQLEVQTQYPPSKKLVLIDALTGQLSCSLELLHTSSVDGIAHTRYSGKQNIITDSISPDKFLLLDKTRGNGIRTVNDNNGIEPFEDDDNIWNNQNEQQDDIATDAHFAAEVSYDFFKNYFNHDSYDNLGSEIINKIHVGTKFNNAYWDGSSMNYGDGDGVKYGPHTSLDICAHEFTHGVTQESAGLVYRYESGALNESFSDIFGKTIEHKHNTQNFTWNLGEKIALEDKYIFRSMSNPNDRYHPKFYKGKYWEYSDFDQGGVHINSGVLNFWYYLLVEGGKGKNEIQELYDVHGLGFDKSIKIVYRMLSTYLTPTAQYKDAYVASLNATQDLFGLCSVEYQSVKQAWHAVGFDQAFHDDDLAIKLVELENDDCQSKDVVVKIIIINNSCQTTLPKGSTIQVGFRYNNFIPIQDEITLSEPLLPLDTLSYSFFNIIKVRREGLQRISSWVSQSNDPNNYNDTASYSFNYLPYQNSDFALIRSNPTADLICSDFDKIFLYNQLKYLGCDTLPKGTIIPYLIIIGSDTVKAEINTRLRTAPQMVINFTSKIDYSSYGFDNTTIQLDYPNDLDPRNNISNTVLYKTKKIIEGYSESFDSGQMDSTQMLVSSNSKNINYIIKGKDQLIMTGHNILDSNDQLMVRTHVRDDIFFRLNEDYITNLTFCSNINLIDNPYLSFDLAQNKSKIDFDRFDIKPSNSTMVGLKIDGRDVGPLIINPSRNGEFYHYEFDLSPYKHLRSVSIQIKCLALQSNIDSNGIINKIADNNIIDNIMLFSKTTTKQTEPLNNKTSDIWQIYPNPTISSWSFRRIETAIKNNTIFQVYSLSGKLVIEKKTNEHTFHFGSELVSGIYILKIIENNTAVKTSRIIKI